ncbi:MAG: outer membrane beta-barrel protein [Candidatus Aminicenantales bacterium]
MKKFISLFIMGLALSISVQAMEIFGGLQAGLRTVSDSEIREVYGNGLCLFPYLAVNPWKGVIAGAGYELGYSKSGKIGLLHEATTLKVSGFEFFAGYQMPLGIITPYALAGFGSFFYMQTVDSPAAQDVDASKATFFFAVGAKVHPLKGLKNLFACAEFKFIPLSVKPFDESVDLGGMRLTLGLGFAFGL